MRIAQLARATGLTADTIRFYEKMNIVLPPTRLANGYRDYGPSTVACLLLCRKARALGFSLAEVRELGSLVDARRLPRSTVVARLRAKQRDIDERITGLRRLRSELARAIKDPTVFVTVRKKSAHLRAHELGYETR